MTGVPTARGCDACRKQKKGCDQAKPACSRCTRLNIPCVGAGQKRFKFINKDGPSGHVASRGRMVLARVSSQIPPNIPASREALIAGSMTSRLKVTDLRYDISCFGGFLHLIPERIGTNLALDMTTDAFAAASANLETPERVPSEALVKHGRALRALRDCISDPVQRTKPETVCAVYLTTITEVLLQDMPGGHATVIVYLLDKGVYRDWTSKFDLAILATMYFYVLLETVGNPAIRLGPWVSDLLDKLEPRVQFGPIKNEYHFPSMGIRGLTRIAVALRDPIANYADLILVYREVCEDRGKMRQLFAVMFPDDSHSPGPLGLGAPFREFITQMSMTTALCLALNRTLQEFTPNNTSLETTARSLEEDIVNMADKSLPYKPLGASHVLSGLSVAWAATRDPETRARLTWYMDQMDGCGFPCKSRLREAAWWQLKFSVVGSQARKFLYMEEEDEEFLEMSRELMNTQCHVQ